MKWSIQTTRSMGRSMVGTERIFRGEVVIADEPAVCVPFESQSSQLPPEFDLTILELNMQAAAQISSSSYKGFAAILASRLILKKFRDEIFARATDSLCRNISPTTTELCVSAQVVQRLAQGNGVNVDIQECLFVLQQLSSNAFTIVNSEMSPIGIGVYVLASAINHSCSPNCCQSFDERGGLTIRATRDILADEEILISYVEVSKSSYCRRAELIKSYQFYCNCTRCCCFDALDCYNSTCARSSDFELFQHTMWRSMIHDCVNDHQVDTDSFRQFLLELSLPYPEELLCARQLINGGNDNQSLSANHTATQRNTTVPDKIKHLVKTLDDIHIAYRACHKTINLKLSAKRQRAIVQDKITQLQRIFLSLTTLLPAEHYACVQVLTELVDLLHSLVDQAVVSTSSSSSSQCSDVTTISAYLEHASHLLRGLERCLPSAHVNIAVRQVEVASVILQCLHHGYSRAHHQLISACAGASLVSHAIASLTVSQGAHHALVLYSNQLLCAMKTKS